ncbi:MAG: aromatic amino acid lyase [Chloroflexi bacterium]|nr:aromatic amino acid lyase [Chloroflexota bacterium]
MSPGDKRSQGVVVIGQIHLTVDDVASVAAGAKVELDATAIDRIRCSRAVVDRLVSGEALVYGLNTGLGHMRNERLPLDALRQYQRFIVSAHTGGIGPGLPTEVVRAAMVVRLAGLATGGAGASLPVATGLARLLNGRVHPVVPEVGSVGASDLMHMAAVASVLIGEGWAEFEGSVLPGADALRRARIDPVELEPKDGLALISANGVSVGQAALVVVAARRAAALADVALAVSMEAFSANPSIVDPVVLAAKPIAGQVEAGRRIRALLAGTGRATGGPGGSVQDPLSFRVGPQVHGAFRTFVDLLAVHTELELNASDDNPFVDTAGDRMVSNGNFHPMALALCADAIRPALAHVAQLSDRRMNHLFARLVADPSRLMDPVLMAGTSLAGLLMRYSAAARTAELRGMAGPATLDVAPLVSASRTTRRMPRWPSHRRRARWPCWTTSWPSSC